MRPMPVLVLLATALLSGCAREEPVTLLSHDQAMQDDRPRQVHVLRITDQVEDGSGDNRDVDVSHWVKVRVLDGPGQGTLLLLPYDDWNVGRPPPRAGTDLVVAPADWVRRAPDSQGRPFHGWSRP